jgi:hypothetical protein
MKQVVHDAMLRQYDVLFFHKHPKEAKTYGEWFMRPLFGVSRYIGLSLAGFLMLSSLTLLLISLALGNLEAFMFELFVIGTLLFASFVFFAMLGYKRVAYGINPNELMISERITCSTGLILFYITILIARITGSLKFRAIMV